MEDSTLVLKKYILLKIYTEAWTGGQKIPSAGQLAIKFDVSINTVKKVLTTFLKLNILVSQKRIGYKINPNIFELLPLSLRRKYDVNPSAFYIDKNKRVVNITKEYTNGQGVLVFVETEVLSNLFIFAKYQKKQTFMWNLSFNGICVFRFDSLFEVVDIKSISYILEKRNLYDENDVLIAKEKIYVPMHMWKGHKKISII